MLGQLSYPTPSSQQDPKRWFCYTDVLLQRHARITYTKSNPLITYTCISHLSIKMHTFKAEQTAKQPAWTRAGLDCQSVRLVPQTLKREERQTPCSTTIDPPANLLTKRKRASLRWGSCNTKPLFIKLLKMVVAFSSRVRILGGRFDKSIHACVFLNRWLTLTHQLHSFRFTVMQWAQTTVDKSGFKLTGNFQYFTG